MSKVDLKNVDMKNYYETDATLRTEEDSREDVHVRLKHGILKFLKKVPKKSKLEANE